MTSIESGARREARLAAIGGGLAWLAWVAVRRPAPVETDWAAALLLLVPLVLVPLALLREGARAGRVRAHAFGAAALLLSFLLEPGVVAAGLGVPWLVATGLPALEALRRLLRIRRRPLAAVGKDAGLLFLTAGAGWAVVSRAGLRPLGFEDAIVLLTAIHFHHAGFALSTLASWAAEARPASAVRWAVAGVAAAVPLVAIGITVERLGGGRAMETACAWLLSACAFGVAAAHLRLAADRRVAGLPRALFGLSGAALAGSTVLAALYAARALVDLSWLDLPTMRALHGTANALGFALPSFLAWSLSPRG